MSDLQTAMNEVKKVLTVEQKAAKARAAAIREEAKLETASTADIQKALNRKHYQSQAGSAMAEAMNAEPKASMLSNPMETLDKLASITPSAEYFASSAIVGSLGYSVCNNLLWAYRKAHAQPKIPAATIDIFNGMFADMFEKRADKEMSEDNGHASLPDFDVSGMTGIYMQMLYMQRGNPDYAAKYPPKLPHEILHEMQVKDRSEELNEAYASLETAQIADSPAAAAILAEKQRTVKKLDEHQVRIHKAEMEYVLTELRDAIPAKLDDDVWAGIPLYIQYKWSVFVYRQCVKALVQETLARERNSNNFDRLLGIINPLHLELEAAARSAEVKLAFEKGRLDERHELIATPGKTLIRIHGDTRSVHTVKH